MVRRSLFALNDDSPGRGSVWQRALYHASVPQQQVSAPKRKAPHFPKRPKFDEHGNVDAIAQQRFCVREPVSRNARAWLHVLRDMRSLVAKPAYLPLIELIEIMLSRLSSTCTVERWFKDMRLTELKQRAGKLGPDVFEASLKLRVQDLGGVRPSVEFDPRKLLIKDHAAVTRSGAVVPWPGTEYALHCQSLYAEYFGTRRCECRSMAIKSAAEQCHAPPGKVRLSVGKEAAENSVKSMKRKHAAAITAAVAAQEIRAVASSSSSSTSAIATAPLNASLSSISAVAAAVVSGDSSSSGSQGVVNGAARASASSSTLLELVADMVADKKAKRKGKSPASNRQ